MRSLVLGVLAVGCGDVATVELATRSHTLDSTTVTDVVTLGDPVLSGTGCPDGGVGIEGDGDSLWMQFDALEVGPGRRYRACNVGLPFEAAPGYQLGLSGMGVAGTATGNPAARLRVAKFFVGSPEVALELDWPPTGASTGFDDVWSECGGTGIARWALSLRAVDGGEASLLAARADLVARPCE